MSDRNAAMAGLGFVVACFAVALFVTAAIVQQAEQLLPAFLR